MAATAPPLLLPPGPRSASRAWLRGGGGRPLSFNLRGSGSGSREPPCRCWAKCGGGADGGGGGAAVVGRRGAVGAVALSSSYAFGVLQAALAGGLPPEEKPKLCDAECEKELENAPMVTTESGLQYKDIRVGQGPSPPIGFQVAAECIAMVPNGQIFDSSLEKGTPYIFRVGAGQVIKGLDEGILSMKVGGLRRLYIPGPLAFPKGLTSAPGRPRVAPSSPVVFDVNLLYIPGLDDE